MNASPRFFLLCLFALVLPLISGCGKPQNPKMVITDVVNLLVAEDVPFADIPFVELKGHTDHVVSAAFLPGETKIVTGSWDGTARLWDAKTGEELSKITGLAGYHTTFSPDGKKIATRDAVPNAKDGIARVWDTESGKELFTHSGYHEAFSPDGKKLFTTDYTQDVQNRSVQIWDAESGEELYTLPGMLIRPFSPDGKKVATGITTSEDGIQVWDVESGKELYTSQGWVNVSLFSPDGKKIVTEVDESRRIFGFTLSENTSIRIWDAASGKLLHTLPGGFICTSPVFSPDGKKIVTRDAKSARPIPVRWRCGKNPSVLRIWDTDTGKELQKLEGHPGIVSHLHFSPDGRKIVVNSLHLLELNQMWDVESGDRLWSIERFFRFSQDGKEFFVLRSGSIQVWDTESAKALYAYAYSGRLLRFFNDKKKFITVNEDNTVRIWDFSAMPKNEIPLAPAEQPISPLDLPPVIDEDLIAFREQILAAEKAKELTLIEEERNTVPLVENPDALIALHPEHRLWITPDRKNVVMIGRVILREGFLELLACRVGTKEHESILAVRVEPQLIHAALLAANARQGRPMQMSPVFTPATGDRIGITLRWKDESGTQHESPAQDWVWDMSASPEHAKKPMTTHWVFSGSRMVQDYEGNDRYLANETGELFGLSNFVGSILDVPIRSSEDNTQLMFGCLTERIPSLDTLVTIILSPQSATQ